MDAPRPRIVLDTNLMVPGIVGATSISYGPANGRDGIHVRHQYQRGWMNYQPISLREKFGLFDDHWSPRVVAEMNDYQFKIVKLKGDFIWHDHPETDETFFVIEGSLRIDFPDGAVTIGPGELFIVPKGVRHKPCADDEVKLMLIEPRGVRNTGHEGGERSAPNDVWI